MSPLQRTPWILLSLWQNLFALCIQTSFLILKHVKSRLADVHGGYDWSPAFGFVLQLSALRRGCSKSHFNWWSPVLFPPFPPEQAGRPVGLALGHAEAVRTKQYQHGPSRVLVLAGLADKTLKLLAVSNTVKKFIPNKMGKFP